MSFRNYILTRKYHFGRSSPVNWAFIATAKGNPHLRDAHSWGELRRHLIEAGADESKLKAAQAVWRNYRTHVRVQRSAIP